MFTDFSIDAILGAKSPPMVAEAHQMEVGESSIRVFLQSAPLWKRFHALGTEMIVTKSGRRMFPTLSILISGLDAKKSYVIMVDLECVEPKRFRYSFHQSKWIATGPGESELPSRMFVHPDSPAKGAHWMRGPITFDKMKLTNNQMDNNGHIIVNSMHKYRPRIHVIEHNNETSRRRFSFDETQFIAVTAYQNHRITSLKIESNPFAKGFRECEIGNGNGPGIIAAEYLDQSVFQNMLPFVYPFFAQNYCNK